MANKLLERYWQDFVDSGFADLTDEEFDNLSFYDRWAYELSIKNYRDLINSIDYAEEQGFNRRFKRAFIYRFLKICKEISRENYKEIFRNNYGKAFDEKYKEALKEFKENQEKRRNKRHKDVQKAVSNLKPQEMGIKSISNTETKSKKRGQKE